MNPWLDSFAVLLLAGAGVYAGLWFSRLRRPYWVIGYFVPLVLTLLYGLASRWPTLAFAPPFSWLVMGRNKFASIAIIATMVLTTPLSRIHSVRARSLIVLLMTLIVAHLSVWPFLAPAFNRSYLAKLRTTIDKDGVCLQSNDYNCGPAAAVTALRQLGLPASEGEIAILAHTSSATGTPPDILARALQERYARDGLVSQYRVFKTIEELRHSGITLAVIRYSFWFDHYLTVLQLGDGGVLAGDPSVGLVVLPRKEFERRWRFVGVVLSRPKDKALVADRTP